MQVMAALRTFGAVVEVVGWDEAFLAVDTDDPHGFAREVQARVRETTRLQCTVGIGQNKLQAVLATGFGKPAGVFALTDPTWFEVLAEPTADPAEIERAALGALGRFPERRPVRLLGVRAELVVPQRFETV